MVATSARPGGAHDVAQRVQHQGGQRRRRLGGQQRVDVVDDQHGGPPTPRRLPRRAHGVGHPAAAAPASSAAAPGAASSTQEASTAAAALCTRVTFPTPSGPTTSTPSRGEPPSRASSSGLRRRQVEPLDEPVSRFDVADELVDVQDGLGARFRADRRRGGHRSGRRDHDLPAAAVGTGRRPHDRRAHRAGDALRGLPGGGTALPADDRARVDRHRARRVDRGHREQLGGPRAAHRTGHAAPRRRNVQAGDGLDVLREQRDGVADGDDLAEQRQPHRLRGEAARARRDPVSSTCLPGSTRAGAITTTGPVGQPGVGQRDVVEGGLPGRPVRVRGRDQRRGDPGAGQAHGVPGAQAERVDHLGVQPDHAAPGVGGGGGEPGDEGDRGSAHGCTLSRYPHHDRRSWTPVARIRALRVPVRRS